jgi:Fe-S cluster biogenesis protein NfuA
MDKIKKKIESANSTIHSYVYANGGDMKLLHISDDMKIDIELSGIFHMKTFEESEMKKIENLFRRYVPEIQKVNFIINKKRGGYYARI